MDSTLQNIFSKLRETTDFAQTDFSDVTHIHLPSFIAACIR